MQQLMLTKIGIYYRLESCVLQVAIAVFSKLIFWQNREYKQIKRQKFYMLLIVKLNFL